MDKLSMLNAEILAVKEAKVTDSKLKPLPRCKQDIMNAKPAVLGRLLERDGCISIPNVLSHKTCDSLLSYINSENERLKELIKGSGEGDAQFDQYFGGMCVGGSTSESHSSILQLCLTQELGAH